MRTISLLLAVFLVLAGTIPASADFKYSETSKITGGTLLGALKVASVFSRQAGKEALQPQLSTHYIKGNRLRVDQPEGKIEIIDLDGRRFIEIDSEKKTYKISTFEQMKAALDQAIDKNKQEMAKKQQDTQVTLKPKVYITPGGATQVILGQEAKETKMEIDMEMEAQDTKKQTGPQTANIAMSFDMWVAPAVKGYSEFAEFYKQMAKELNWTPPAGIKIDPRMTQGLEEMRKNSGSLRGLPMLQYVSMMLSAPNALDGTQNAPSQNPKPESTKSSSDDIPTSASGAVIKGLGGLFGKKKKQDAAASQPAPDALPPPPSNPNSLMDMTIQVTSFSDSSLDSSLFDVPDGFTQMQADPNQILGAKEKH